MRKGSMGCPHSPALRAVGLPQIARFARSGGDRSLSAVWLDPRAAFQKDAESRRTVSP